MCDELLVTLQTSGRFERRAEVLLRDEEAARKQSKRGNAQMGRHKGMRPVAVQFSTPNIHRHLFFNVMTINAAYEYTALPARPWSF
jgi:hypothetical protein